MYAIVENGSKQYKAEVGQVIRFEKLSANVGDKVEFDVLMVSDEN
ncbi:MAG: 50S ribosomal protein L21, partial [Clostridiales bacterium]|nr:50S ribosomal protein L21 [Clostridiales bacterium]